MNKPESLRGAKAYLYAKNEIKNDDDFEFPLGTEYKVVIDAMSMQ